MFTDGVNTEFNKDSLSLLFLKVRAKFPRTPLSCSPRENMIELHCGCTLWSHTSHAGMMKRQMISCWSQSRFHQLPLLWSQRVCINTWLHIEGLSLTHSWKFALCHDNEQSQTTRKHWRKRAQFSPHVIRHEMHSLSVSAFWCVALVGLWLLRMGFMSSPHCTLSFCDLFLGSHHFFLSAWCVFIMFVWKLQQVYIAVVEL